MSSLPSERVVRARSTLIWEMFSIRVARSLPPVDSVVLTLRVILMAKRVAEKTTPKKIKGEGAQKGFPEIMPKTTFPHL